MKTCQNLTMINKQGFSGYEKKSSFLMNTPFQAKFCLRIFGCLKNLPLNTT